MTVAITHDCPSDDGDDELSVETGEWMIDSSNNTRLSESSDEDELSVETGEWMIDSSNNTQLLEVRVRWLG